MFQGKDLPSSTLLALFDALGEAVFSATESGELTAINSIGASLLGFTTPEDALAEPFGVGFFSRLPEWDAFISEATRGAGLGPSRRRLQIVNRRGDPLIIELALTLHAEEAKRTVAGIFRDVSGSEELARNLVGRNSELEALRQLAVDATRYDELEPLLTSMLEVCSKAVGASGGAIYLYDVATKRLAMQSSIGLELPQEVKSLKLGQGYTGKVAVSRAPVLVDELSQDPNLEFPTLRGLAIRNFASFPLLVKNRLLGIVNFYTIGSAFLTGRDFSLLSVLAAQVSLSLDHMVRVEELRDRNAELEKFNRLGVDRELRMVELKKRVRELETTASIEASLKKSKIV